MIFSTLKRRLAAQLQRAAVALAPPPAPLILPASHLVPSDPLERAKLYERIAFTAIAWLGHQPAIQTRAAAVGVITRSYPGIGEYVELAHGCAMAFHPQLQQLLRDEEAAAAQDKAEQGKAPC